MPSVLYEIRSWHWQNAAEQRPLRRARARARCSIKGEIWLRHVASSVNPSIGNVLITSNAMAERAGYKTSSLSPRIYSTGWICTHSPPVSFWPQMWFRVDTILCCLLYELNFLSGKRKKFPGPPLACAINGGYIDSVVPIVKEIQPRIKMKMHLQG